MLFATADGFWKSPNIYDVSGLAGFIVGVASIWISWWLAKRDIEKRLEEAADRAAQAARDEVRRVANALVQTGIADAIRSLELVREVCNAKRWPRAEELCQICRVHLIRILEQPTADPRMKTELREVSAIILDCIQRLRIQPKSGTGQVPAEVIRGLDDTILKLHEISSRMTAIRLEGDYVEKAP